MLPGRCCQILPNAFRCHQRIPDIAGCWQGLQNSRCIQVTLGDTRIFDFSRWGCQRRQRLLLVRLLNRPYTQLLVAEIQFLVDVTRTTYYKRRCQTYYKGHWDKLPRRSLGRLWANSLNTTSCDTHPPSQCQPQLPKSNY